MVRVRFIVTVKYKIIPKTKRGVAQPRCMVYGLILQRCIPAILNFFAGIISSEDEVFISAKL